MSAENEVLVVASKLKKYIRENSDGMNTSAKVMEALSDSLRGLCDQAIENARKAGRKTVLDRDFTNIDSFSAHSMTDTSAGMDAPSMNN